MAEKGSHLRKRVGRRISELRHAKSLTQDEFAEKLDVSTAYLARVECGNENLTLDTLAKVAGALGSKVAEFFEPPRHLQTIKGRPPKSK